MAKKFGKFVMTTAALGALAAGAYYFFMKKNDFLDDDFDDEDYDDFDDDLDDDETDGQSEADRKYVDLDLTKASEKVEETAEKVEEAAEKVEEAINDKAADFKEGLNAAKAEATDKIVGLAEDTAKAADEAEEKVEEFFDDEDEEYEDNDNSLDAI